MDIQLQHLSDSDGESTKCWGAFQKALCCCCTKRATERKNRGREREEERLMELRRIQEEERQKELQRKMEEVEQKEKRRLRKAMREFEIRRKRAEEEKERQLLQQEVQEKWEEAVQSWRLTKEEMEELKRLKKLEKILPLKIQRLEEKEAMSETWTTSTESEAETCSVGKMEGLCGMQQHQHTKRHQVMLREIERIAWIERCREREQEGKWTRPMERLSDMKKEEMLQCIEKKLTERQSALNNLFMERLNRMEAENERSLEKEIDRHHQLEMQLKEMEHRFAMERQIQLNRHEERLRELESEWKLEYEAKIMEMEHYLERERVMAERREEELFRVIEQQQKIKMKTLKNTKTTIGQERLSNQNFEREAEQWEEECHGLESEAQREKDRESTMRERSENTVQSAENEHEKQMQREQEKFQEMEEQLKTMQQKFEMEKEMEAKRYEERWRKMEEKRQKEWEEKIRELQKTWEEEKQGQVFLKPQEEQNKGKEVLTRMEIPAEVEKEETKRIEETREKTELKKVIDPGNECVTEIQQEVHKRKDMEVDLQEGENNLLGKESAMKDKEIQKEEKMVTEQKVPTNKGIESVREKKESRRHTQIKTTEDTLPEVEAKKSLKIGADEERCFKDKKQETKQPMNQKNDGMDWLKELRNKSEGEREGGLEKHELKQNKQKCLENVQEQGELQNQKTDVHENKQYTKEAISQRNDGMDWMSECKVKHEKEVDSESRVAPVVRRRQRASEPMTEKAEPGPKHKELVDDWLGDTNKEDRWAQIRRRHQQSREESRQELQKKVDQAEETEKDKGMVVGRRGRNLVEKTDAEEGVFLKMGKQETKQAKHQGNEGMDWLSEFKVKQEKEVDSGHHVAPVVGRRQKASELIIKKAEKPGPKHKELVDNLLGDTNKEDRWAQIQRRHQQSREESRQELQKQVDQAERAEKDKGVVVGRRARPLRRDVDSKHESETKMEEMESEEWWSELRRNNQRKFMGNQQKQKSEVHMSKPKEQGRQRIHHRTKPEGSLNIVRHTQVKKTEDTLAEVETKEPAKTEMAWLDSKQNKTGQRSQRTESWFGEWMQTKKYDAKHEIELHGKESRDLREVRGCRREEDRRTAKEEAVGVQGLGRGVQDPQVTDQQMKNTGTSRLWESLRGELDIQPCGSWKETNQTDLEDIPLAFKRQAASPLQQTVTGHQWAAIDKIQDKTKLEIEAAKHRTVGHAEILEVIRLNENEPLCMTDVTKTQSRIRTAGNAWAGLMKESESDDLNMSTKDLKTTLTLQRNMDTQKENKRQKELMTNSEEMAKENKQTENATQERQRQKERGAHKMEEVNKTRTQREIKKETKVAAKTEDQAPECSKSPSVVPLLCPSSDASNGEKERHEEQFKDASADSAKEGAQPVEEIRLGRSPSLVNLLDWNSDASDDKEERPENASLCSAEKVMECSEGTANNTVKDKSVRRKVIGWINTKAKEYYNRKIEKTFKREEEEGHKEYSPWYSTSSKWRAEREQEKRKELLKAEEKRQRLESSWQQWEAERAEKKRRKKMAENLFDCEDDDSLWFVEDLL
ncbi:hypothetical protein ACEWY4_011283 [Coilia grayii]|uniref:Trichohyalin-like n=1 Tax=Coilia grayii TaxID=363190 RepID=A0ABD1K4A5_9TELE